MGVLNQAKSRFEKGPFNPRGLGAFIAIFFLFSGLLRAEERYEFAISGAGPVGLASALELQSAGSKDLIVFEGREQEPALAAHSTSYSNAYGSRTRTVILDDRSVEQLRALGVDLPGVSLSELHIYQPGGHYILPNQGVWKRSFIYSLFGRSASNIVRIGELENALLEKYIKNGGKIFFGAKPRLENTQAGVEIQIRQPGHSMGEMSAQFAIVAEGSKSETVDELGIKRVPLPRGHSSKLCESRF